MYYAVDVLRTVGLRDNDLSSDDAVITDGPTGKQDAFILQRKLSASVSDKKWDLIGSDLPSQFGVYTAFNSLNYHGSIFALHIGTDAVLEVSLGESVTSSEHNSLFILLPGITPVVFDVPFAPSDAPFQDIGIRLQHSQLVVVVNCTLVDFVTLDRDPDPFLVMNETVVEIFGNGAIVSLLRSTCTISTGTK